MWRNASIDWDFSSTAEIATGLMLAAVVVLTLVQIAL